jgi:hypothetical protein
MRSAVGIPVVAVAVGEVPGVITSVGVLVVVGVVVVVGVLVVVGVDVVVGVLVVVGVDVVVGVLVVVGVDVVVGVFVDVGVGEAPASGAVHSGIRDDPMRVCHSLPFSTKYSLVNQKVQSSDGSGFMEL